MQVCAQDLCLEEMLRQLIALGYVYAQPHRCQSVEIPNVQSALNVECAEYCRV
ncbi:MAG: hypothetical protein HC857_12450 [Synechococcales cyanobacterium RU_4_20]|nr:hypothetical protein [Synechococcales cyanobacterium RU_4_20]